MEKAIAHCLYLWLVISFAVSGSYCQNSLKEHCIAATVSESTTIHLTVSNVTYITSPHFSNPYPGLQTNSKRQNCYFLLNICHNLDLNWTVAAPVSSGQVYVLLLQVVAFELEDKNNTKCPRDSLSIYDPADSFNDRDLCGQTVPSDGVVCTRGSNAFIRFRTDGSWCYNGFNLSIEALSTSQASVHPMCLQTTSTTTTTLSSTRSRSTSVTRTSKISQSATVRNSWPSAFTLAQSNLSTFVSTTITEGTKGSSKTGAVVGGVVGGLLAAALLVGLFVFLRHWLLKRRPASVEAEKEPPSDDTDDKTTSTLFSPTKLIREPTCAPAATFPVPRPLTAAPVHLQA